MISKKEQILNILNLKSNFDIFYRRVKILNKYVDLVYLTTLVDSYLVLETIKSIKVINNKTIIKLRESTLRKIRKNIKKQEYLFKNKRVEFKTIFSCINDYENCFKYDKIKVSRILDKYTG